MKREQPIWCSPRKVIKKRLPTCGKIKMDPIKRT